jgi:hypothetical protein
MKFNIPTATEPENEVEWTNWYEGISEVGDSFSLQLEKVSFNEEKAAIYLIGAETATTVYAQHHENAKFKNSTTHGVRVINAFARKLALTGEIESATLFDGIATLLEGDEVLTIKAEKTEKGLLWTVA